MPISHGDTSTNFTCGECGAEETSQLDQYTAAVLRKRQRCHGCFYWLIRIEALADPKQGPRFVRTEEGRHYQMRPDNEDRGSRGHAGRPFIITFYDGRKVRTTNLWGQGKIPERFRDRLPPNATVELEPLQRQPIPDGVF